MNKRYCIICGDEIHSNDPTADRCLKHGGPHPAQSPIPQNFEKARRPGHENSLPLPQKIEPWQPGKVILDTYVVKSKLGEGGFGQVYRVHHKGWNMDLAVKRPRADKFKSEKQKQDFLREAETWVDLGLHPHITSCLYVRTIDDVPHVFVECVEGGSLENWIQGKKGNLYVGDPKVVMERILDIAIQFTWGLGYAHEHEKKLIHRDVKPDNALMTPDGILKVTDFGLARSKGLTPDGETQAPSGNIKVSGKVYSPYHCSPEQVAGTELSIKTDIWSWGVSVLEMFNGKITWMGGQIADSALESYLRGVGAPHIPPMPDTLAELLRECLQRHPDNRPADMLTITEKLMRIYHQEVGQAYPREKPDPAELKADSLNNKAVSLTDIGKWEQARQCWQEALSSDSHHLESNFNYGYLLWQEGKQTDLDYANQVSTLQAMHGSRPLYWYLLAAVQLERGELIAAETAAKKCSDSDLANLGQLRDAIQSRKIFPETGGHPSLPWRHLITELIPEDDEDGLVVSLTGDAKWCLTGSRVGLVSFWDIEKKILLWSWNPHRSPIMGVAIALDASIGITAGEDQKFFVWNLKKHKKIHKYHLPSRITTLNTTPDFKFALLGTINGPTTLWDVQQFKIISSLDHGCRLSALSANAHYALTEVDGTLWYWDLQNQQLLKTENLSQDLLQAINLSADGRYALFSSDEIDLCMLDLTQLRRTILNGHTQPINDLAFSPDQRFAISVSGSENKPNHDYRLRLWDLERKYCLWTSPECKQPVISLSLDRKAHHAITLTKHASLQLWNLDLAIVSKSQIPSPFPFILSTPKSGHILLNALREAEILEKRAAACESRGQWEMAYQLIRKVQNLRNDPWRRELISALSRLGKHARRKRLSDFHILRMMAVDHVELFATAALFNQGQVVCGDSNGKLNLFDMATGKCLRTMETTGNRVLHLAATTNEKEVFVVSQTKNLEYLIQRWDTFSWERIDITILHSVFDMNLSPDDRFMIVSEASGVIIFDIQRMESLQTLRPANVFDRIAGKRPISAKVTPDMQRAITGSEDGRVTFWDIATGKEGKNLDGHQKAVDCIEISKDGLIGLSGGQGNQLCVWDFEHMQLQHRFELPNNIKGLALSADGHHAFSWGEAPTIDAWDLYQLDHVCKLIGHEKAIKDFQISPDGHTAVSCGLDGKIILWELDWEYKFPKRSA